MLLLASWQDLRLGLAKFWASRIPMVLSGVLVASDVVVGTTNAQIEKGPNRRWSLCYLSSVGP
jgi:hypothetical protein